MPTRVVVLDDDQEFRAFLCAIFVDAGYEAHGSTAGIGVHEVVRDLAPVAVILDVPADPSASTLHWPALAVLAHDAATRRIPLLACVPDDDEDAARQVAALGLPSSVVLCKPLALDDLLARLRRLAGTSLAS